MSNRRCAVIGGGAAGLAAAWRLRDAGAEVVLYESEPRFGGRLATDELDGYRIDYAVQLLASTYETVFAVARGAGVSDRLVRSRGRDALWREGKAHGLEYGSVSSLVASTALPAGLKLRMGMRYLPYLSTAARGLDANDPARTGGAALDDASVAEWGSAVLGRDFVELMAYPLLGAYYGAAPERMSVALYHALARVGRSVEVYAAADGMGGFAESVASALGAAGVELRRSDRVVSVRADAAGVAVESGSGGSRYDCCVLAVPARAVAPLIGATDPLLAWLSRVETVPALTVALLLDRRLGVDYFGLSFPRGSAVGDLLVAACVESVKARGLVPAGRELLVLYPAPARVPELLELGADAIVDALMPAIESVFPGVASWTLRARLYRIAGGHTLFYPGYLRHLTRYDASWPGPRLALAGDYLAAPTVEGAASSGVRAAERLLASS